MTEGSALALDIGATKIAAAVVTGDGTVSGWTTAPTRRDEGPDRVIERLFALGDDALAATGAKPSAAGISCGGPLDPWAGLLLGPLHLPGWDRVPIRDLTEQRFGLPGTLVNDGSAGAWAEFRFGAAADAGSAVYLTVSSGVGGGAVLDGHLLVGASGNGGEFGHIAVRPGGRRCRCGRDGCVEAYAAGTQMAERVREALAAGERSALADIDESSAADVARLAGTDALAGRIWSEGVAALADGIVDLVNVLEPERVVLGGGVTRSGAMLFGPVRDAVARWPIAPIRRIVTVVPATLGAPVCAIGAGALALEARGRGDAADA